MLTESDVDGSPRRRSSRSLRGDPRSLDDPHMLPPPHERRGPRDDYCARRGGPGSRRRGDHPHHALGGPPVPPRSIYRGPQGGEMPLIQDHWEDFSDEVGVVRSSCAHSSWLHVVQHNLVGRRAAQSCWASCSTVLLDLSYHVHCAFVVWSPRITQFPEYGEIVPIVYESTVGGAVFDHRL